MRWNKKLIALVLIAAMILNMGTPVWAEEHSADRSRSGEKKLATPVEEQYSLATGKTYYFDLSQAGVIGTINPELPDQTLHYVPFVYTGTINAYSLDASSSGNFKASDTASASPTDRSLFLAEHNVSMKVSWDALNNAGLIFGKPFDTNYILRSLSGGYDKGYPTNNEWNSIYNKNNGWIKNGIAGCSWMQDTSNSHYTERTSRGYHSVLSHNSHISIESSIYTGLRPALEVRSSDALKSDGLKPVTLNLNGCSFGGRTDNLTIICSGKIFQAPGTTGLTTPMGTPIHCWKDSNSDTTYAPGDAVPSTVTGLTAQYDMGLNCVTTNGGTTEVIRQTGKEPGKGKDNALKLTTGGTYVISQPNAGITTQDRIIVDPGAGNTANITLKDVNISADCAFEIKSGIVNLTLEGTNTLTSTGEHAGLQQNKDAGLLTIGGTGSLTANGGTLGIGGGQPVVIKSSGGSPGESETIKVYDGVAATITINSGTLVANGIGGSDAKAENNTMEIKTGGAATIIINGGTVTSTKATGFDIGGGKTVSNGITITGASPNYGTANIRIIGGNVICGSYSMNGGVVDADGAMCQIGGGYYKTNSRPTSYYDCNVKINGGRVMGNCMNCTSRTIGELDIKNSLGQRIYANNNTYYLSSGSYTVSGSTTKEHIAADPGSNETLDITLNGATIDLSGKKGVCAFEVTGAGKTTLTLASNNSNTIKSGEGAAGISATGKDFTITAQDASGKLEVFGGNSCSDGTGGTGGSGINGGSIAGGTVTGTGGTGGNGGNGGNGGTGGSGINGGSIAGGTVTGTGGTGGIGSNAGSSGTGGTGGTGGIGISGGNIAGGTVAANGGSGGMGGSSGIGGGIGGIDAPGGTGANIANLPQGTPAVPYVYTFSGMPNKNVSNLLDSNGNALKNYLGSAYGEQDIFTDSNGKIYLWHTNTTQSGNTAACDGNTYTSDAGGMMTTNGGVATVSAVTVTPTAASVEKGKTQQFSAVVTGTNNPAQTVSWTVTGGIKGTSISAGGLLTVAAGETATKIKVTATSTADTSKSATVEVQVRNAAQMEYRITFDGNGGSVVPESAMTVNGTLSSLPKPERSSYRFDGWFTAATGGEPITIDRKFSANSTIYAHWTYTESSTGGGLLPYIPEVITLPVDIIQMTVETKLTKDLDGRTLVTVTDQAFQAAIHDVMAQMGGQSGYQIALVVKGKALENSTGMTFQLKKSVQEMLISKEISSITLLNENTAMGISMRIQTLKELNTRYKSDFRFLVDFGYTGRRNAKGKAAPVRRPLIRVQIQDETGNTVENFGDGGVMLSIPYTLRKGEKAGNVYGISKDKRGRTKWINGSVYDAENKVLRIPISRSSMYGVGYKKDRYTCTDIQKHWAYTPIAYALPRNLLVPTGKATFSPDSGVTREVLVTALGRLAGINTKNYKGGSFKDVKAKAYYAPYVNWAVKLGIVKGKSQTLFEPTALVSRQEMAVILANYAKVMKFDLPKTREEIKYLDESSIDAGAKEAVTALQMAGILMGKEGNRLDPTGIATRAEVAALLVRYRELVLDPATAQGLEVNDSGQLLYYEQGHLFTGTKVIDGRTYYFGTDGICFRIEE